MAALRRVRGGFVGGGFTDHHVHLQLVDARELAGGVLGRVVDLGGDPLCLAALAQGTTKGAALGQGTTGRATPGQGTTGRAALDQGTTGRAGLPEMAFAGAFLTPPGGYPSDRGWAPEGSVREIADAEAAHAAIAEMVAAGASRIKVASNRTAGPVFSDDLFAELVRIAASFSLPVVAHAEGAGEAQRAARLGSAVLAHAPFTERLDDAEIAAQAARVQWISTLAIHDDAARAIAVDNVRRFHAAGGRVRYGTDMGNGPTPVGLNPAEIAALREAGIDGPDLLRALAPVEDDRLFHSAEHESEIDPLLARPLTPADLEA